MTTNYKNTKQNRKNYQHDERERITAKTLAAVLLSRWAADIKEGKSPWARPCYTLQALAISHDTGRRYSLSNQALLDAEKPTEYTTFVQAKKEGGHVIKGAKANYINYFRELKKQNETDEAQPDDEPETDEAQPARRMLFAQGVFALDQTEGTRARWEYPQTMSPAAARARVDFWREKFPQIFERTETTEAALFVICKTWDEASATKPEDDDDEAAAAFNASSIIAAALAAALIVKATGETPTNPAPIDEIAEALNEHPMRIYSIIARAEKAARALLKMEEDPQPVKLPQPEKTEAEPEQEQPEPAKMPVFIATKNKYCEPFPGETLPFKKIPSGALVKLTKTGLTRHDVEIFTGGLFYRAKVKNLLFLEESPAQVWPGLKPEKTEPEQKTTPAAVPQVLTYEKPQPVTTCAPLRAVLIDDDDDDDAEPLAVCTLAAL